MYGGGVHELQRDSVGDQSSVGCLLLWHGEDLCVVDVGEQL